MRLFGHPIHPMLVHFPIVFWTVAAVAYVASAVGITAPLDAVAKFANGAGLTMALLAMLAGLFELRTIDSRSEAMRVAALRLQLHPCDLIVNGEHCSFANWKRDGGQGRTDKAGR